LFKQLLSIIQNNVAAENIQRFKKKLGTKASTSTT